MYRGGKFRRENAFIGIQKDTPATIILQSTSFLRNIKKQVEGCHRNWEMLLDLSIVKNTTIEEFVEFQEDSEEWKLIVRVVMHKIVYICLTMLFIVIVS